MGERITDDEPKGEARSRHSRCEVGGQGNGRFDGSGDSISTGTPTRRCRILPGYRGFAPGGIAAPSRVSCIRCADRVWGWHGADRNSKAARAGRRRRGAGASAPARPGKPAARRVPPRAVRGAVDGWRGLPAGRWWPVSGWASRSPARLPGTPGTCPTCRGWRPRRATRRRCSGPPTGRRSRATASSMAARSASTSCRAISSRR